MGLPTATWSMENFTVEEYEQNLQAIKDGLDMNFQGFGAQMKIGDYMEFLRTQMGFY